MNIRFGNKQNLTELAEDLRDIAARKDQPAPFDWDKIRQLIEDNALYLEQYIIPRTPDEEPGYKGSPRIAVFTPPERSDLEMTPDDSAASLVRDDDPTRRFLASALPPAPVPGNRKA